MQNAKKNLSGDLRSFKTFKNQLGGIVHSAGRTSGFQEPKNRGLATKKWKANYQRWIDLEILINKHMF